MRFFAYAIMSARLYILTCRSPPLAGSFYTVAACSWSRFFFWLFCKLCRSLRRHSPHDMRRVAGDCTPDNSVQNENGTEIGEAHYGVICRMQPRILRGIHQMRYAARIRQKGEKIMNNTIVSPAEYFEQVKSRKRTMTADGLSQLYENCLLFSKSISVPDKLLRRKSCFSTSTI